MTENRFIQSADEQGYWRIKDTVTGKTSQKYDDTACTWLNELNEENQKLKKVIQAIITKEFELSSDDNGYDPLSEFFNNEVSISQIDIEIYVENQK